MTFNWTDLTKEEQGKIILEATRGSNKMQRKLYKEAMKTIKEENYTKNVLHTNPNNPKIKKYCEAIEKGRKKRKILEDFKKGKLTLLETEIKLSKI